MIGEKLINDMTAKKLFKLCKLVKRNGSVYLSGESLNIPRSSLQDLLNTAQELTIVNNRLEKRALTILRCISVSHARWAINTLNNIQYGGLAAARRSNAVLYLLQTFKPLDFPKVSAAASSDSMALIAALRSLSSLSVSENNKKKILENNK
jgi:methenyltetrahydromethanopterin cyclohydrolase